MDNDAKQGTAAVIENKTQVISRKVWGLENEKQKIVPINADGRVPLRTQKTLKPNVLYATDYTKDVGGETKRAYIQKINNIIETKYI